LSGCISVTLFTISSTIGSIFSGTSTVSSGVSSSTSSGTTASGYSDTSLSAILPMYGPVEPSSFIL
jgi:hypothetical protein